MPETDGVGVFVKDGVGVVVEVPDTDAVGVPVDVPDTLDVGVTLGVPDTVPLGDCDGVGVLVGEGVGRDDAAHAGSAAGELLGCRATSYANGWPRVEKPDDDFTGAQGCETHQPVLTPSDRESCRQGKSFQAAVAALTFTHASPPHGSKSG